MRWRAHAAANFSRKDATSASPRSMKSTLKPFAPSFEKCSATFSSAPYACAHAIHRITPTPFLSAYSMIAGTSTDGLHFQMSSFSLQPSSRRTYSTPLLAAKSMKRLYVSVVQPRAAPLLSKALHQSHATLPGLTQEKL